VVRRRVGPAGAVADGGGVGGGDEAGAALGEGVEGREVGLPLGKACATTKSAPGPGARWPF
jgi:hypothetical protein